jgi:large subunit ribosomal protein L6
MSRIGLRPIPVPKGTKVTIDGSTVTVKGANGELTRTFHPDMTVVEQEGSLIVGRPSDSKLHRSLHGLSRTLLANMVQGVTEGFSKRLEIQGVGYRAEKTGENLTLRLGYSHPVIVAPAGGNSFELEGLLNIIVRGPDKEAVGQQAAEIRLLRKVEPYKGKGIRYAGEQVRRKAGKSAKVGG